MKITTAKESILNESIVQSVNPIPFWKEYVMKALQPSYSIITSVLSFGSSSIPAVGYTDGQRATDTVGFLD
jgi:hypothetical protein